MNRHQAICSLKEQFLILIQKGLIPCHLLAWKTIYETYLVEVETNKKMVTYIFISDYYNISESQVRNIVKFMEG